MHRLLVIGLALVLGSSVPANAQLASGAPDLVLGNGHIFTGAEGKPWVEAVSIKGDRVVAAGTDAAVSATADQHTKIIDLGGRMAMPGINDAHEHVGGASFGLQVLFSPGHGPHGPGPEPSVAELADAVRSAALTARTGEWIHAQVGEAVIRHPKQTRVALDQAGGDHPVEVESWWGHSRM